MKGISGRQTLILVALFIVTSVGFIALDNRDALSPLKTGLHGLVVPIIDTFNGDSGPSDSEVQRQYDDLKAKYDKLQADYAQSQVVVQEVEQLRALLQLQQDQPNLQFVSARVLYPDPTGIEKFVIIDRGSADGIKIGMAVTDPNFFVGLVTAVEEHSSRVTLVIDGKQSVGAQLVKSGSSGIAWGMWQRGGRVELRHVDRSVIPEADELVITACRSEVKTALVPCGLIIGTVNGAPVTDNQADTQTIPVLPAADLEHLTVVAVIISDGTDGS